MITCFLRQENIAPFVTGAVQPKLSQRNLKAIPFVALEGHAASAFGDLAKEFYASIRANSDQSQTLGKTRDLLLPKLMSGEIRVKEAAAGLEAAQ